MPAEAFDFYGAHYRRFGTPLAAATRAMARISARPGGGRSAEQVEIAELLGLGPGKRVLDICCGSGGPSLALAERTGCAITRS